MSVVLHIRILVRGVTLKAGAVSGDPQLGIMWVVTVAAGHAGREHLALLEGTIIVGLLNIQYLSVGVIKTAPNR
jgi:hypothetical protein